MDEEHQEEKKDMKKSAIRGYACEILLMVVRLSDQIDYLYFYSDELLTIGKSDENSKLFELTSWLQWMSVEGGVGGIEWTSLEYSATPKVGFGAVINLANMRCFEKDTKSLRNHLRFVLCSNGQIYDGYFAKSYGLLRIYELYLV